LSDNRLIQNPVKDELRTEKTKGIMFSVLLEDTKTNRPIEMLNSKKPFIWEPWTELEYKERQKKSYDVIKEYFSRI